MTFLAILLALGVGVSNIAALTPKAPATGVEAVVSIPSAPRITGRASWYCLPGRSICTAGFPASGFHAAAGPKLRAELGNWRGKTVTVCVPNCTNPQARVPVRLSDWCQCYAGQPNEKIIDLYSSVFKALGVPLSLGKINVEIQP